MAARSSLTREKASTGAMLGKGLGALDISAPEEVLTPVAGAANKRAFMIERQLAENASLSDIATKPLNELPQGSLRHRDV